MKNIKNKLFLNGFIISLAALIVFLELFIVPLLKFIKGLLLKKKNRALPILLIL